MLLYPEIQSSLLKHINQPAMHDWDLLCQLELKGRWFRAPKISIGRRHNTATWYLFLQKMFFGNKWGNIPERNQWYDNYSTGSRSLKEPSSKIAPKYFLYQLSSLWGIIDYSSCLKVALVCNELTLLATLIKSFGNQPEKFWTTTGDIFLGM